MKCKKLIAGLPKGVGVTKTTNGAGVEFWRVRLGRKFTGTDAVKRDFRTLPEARGWIFGPDAANLHAGVPGVVQMKQQSGAAAFELSHRQLTDASAAYRRLAGVASLADVVAFYLRFHPAAGDSKTLAAAIDALLAAKRASGRSELYVHKLDLTLRKFAAAFEGRSVHQISREAIEQWLGKQQFGLQTQANYIRDTGILFNFAAARKWVAESPLAAIERPQPTPGETCILSLSRAHALMMAAEGEPEMLPSIAIKLFAGLRTSELLALQWEDFGTDQIRVRAANAKTRQRRAVSIPANLAQWLAPYRCQAGAITRLEQTKWHAELVRIAAAAGISPWPSNVLRHSFGSYHFAKYRNEALTAAEMGNSPRMVFRHYRALVESADADAFWKIEPATKGNVIAIPQPAAA